MLQPRNWALSWLGSIHSQHSDEVREEVLYKRRGFIKEKRFYTREEVIREEVIREEVIREEVIREDVIREEVIR